MLSRSAAIKADGQTSKRDIVSRYREPSLQRRCAHECPVIYALLGFCVSVIVKGVAYDNSRWANYDEVDVYNNKEQFPIMSNLLDLASSKTESKCDDAKCKNFFEKLNAMQTVAMTQGKPPVQLKGTFSRGCNRRCERLSLSDGSPSKYEKCQVDKQIEVNEFRTIRFLLIASMLAECVGICAWLFVYLKPFSQTMTRFGLVVAAMLGFVATLLTALACGLFAQAVDVFDDAHIYLGWPFYATCLTAIVALTTCIVAASMLKSRDNNQQQQQLEYLLFRKNSLETILADDRQLPLLELLPRIAKFKIQKPQKIEAKDRAVSTPEVRRPCVSFEHV